MCDIASIGPRAQRVNRLEWTSAEDAETFSQTGLTHRLSFLTKRADFARLNHEWMVHSRHHAGIVVSSQRSIGDLLKRNVVLASSLGADEMRDRLEYLSNW